MILLVRARAFEQVSIFPGRLNCQLACILVCMRCVSFSSLLECGVSLRDGLSNMCELLLLCHFFFKLSTASQEFGLAQQVLHIQLEWEELPEKLASCNWTLVPHQTIYRFDTLRFSLCFYHEGEALSVNGVEGNEEEVIWQFALFSLGFCTSCTFRFIRVIFFFRNSHLRRLHPVFFYSSALCTRARTPSLHFLFQFHCIKYGLYPWL